ncbi:MAG: ubiquinol-cytochrome c reductase iron-sulfur subunit [Gammaproteobacteria bacterium]|nr:ubiquinol-cytochrome c reductase iron-sulfur subunit [Gammaproteobacteria bacterium]
MSEEEVDQGRRRMLTVASAVTGGVGVAALAAPFVLSFKPSARARAVGAPVKVDISKVEMGSLLRVEWRGKPVFILRRSPAALATLPKVTEQLRDPESKKSIQPEFAQNDTRSLDPELVVLLGVCTHLGCAPAYLPEVGTPGADDELVAFLCACHGSKFDVSGRVFKAVPAESNLEVPPYRELGDGWLLIGDTSGAVA